MATRTVHIVYDDIDATTEGIGTYRFAVEGIDYEIDLSADNLATLRAALAPFVAAGRRLPKPTTKARPRSGPGPHGGRWNTAQLRDWWATSWQQLDLPEPRSHGAIPRTVREAYDAAH